MNLQAPELLIILVVVLLLFGASRLPKLARSLGQAQKEFKDGMKETPGGTPPPAPGEGDGTGSVGPTRPDDGGNGEAAGGAGPS